MTNLTCSKCSNQFTFSKVKEFSKGEGDEILEIIVVRCPHCSNVSIAKSDSSGSYRTPYKQFTILAPEGTFGSAEQAREEVKKVIKEFFYDDKPGLIVNRTLNQKDFKKNFKTVLSDLISKAVGDAGVKAAQGLAEKLMPIDAEITKLNQEKLMMQSEYDKSLKFKSILLNETGSVKSLAEIFGLYSQELYKLVLGDPAKGVVGFANNPHRNITHDLINSGLPEFQSTHDLFKDLLSNLIMVKEDKDFLTLLFNSINEAVNVYDNPLYNLKTRELINEGDDPAAKFNEIAYKHWDPGKESIFGQRIKVLADKISMLIKKYESINAKIEDLNKGKELFKINDKTNKVLSDKFKLVDAQKELITKAKIKHYLSKPPVDALKPADKTKEEVIGTIYDISGTGIITASVDKRPEPGDLNFLVKDLLKMTAIKMANGECKGGLVINLYGKESEISFIENKLDNALSSLKESAKLISEGLNQYLKSNVNNYAVLEGLINRLLPHFQNLGVNSWAKLLNFLENFDTELCTKLRSNEASYLELVDNLDDKFSLSKLKSEQQLTDSIDRRIEHNKVSLPNCFDGLARKITIDEAKQKFCSEFNNNLKFAYLIESAATAVAAVATGSLGFLFSKYTAEYNSALSVFNAGSSYTGEAAEWLAFHDLTLTEVMDPSSVYYYQNSLVQGSEGWTDHVQSGLFSLDAQNKMIVAQDQLNALNPWLITAIAGVAGGGLIIGYTTIGYLKNRYLPPESLNHDSRVKLLNLDNVLFIKNNYVNRIPNNDELIEE